jgi:hypothetical protein
VTDGLAPRVDYVVLVDNDDPDTVIEVPWDAVEEEAPGALVRDVAADPPLWHYTGWPDPPALDRLRRRAVPLPPPA